MVERAWLSESDDSFPLVILPLLYGTQVDNFTSVNPSIKWGYPTHCSWGVLKNETILGIRA